MPVAHTRLYAVWKAAFSGNDVVCMAVSDTARLDNVVAALPRRHHRSGRASGDVVGRHDSSVWSNASPLDAIDVFNSGPKVGDIGSGSGDSTVTISGMGGGTPSTGDVATVCARSCAIPSKIVAGTSSGGPRNGKEFVFWRGGIGIGGIGGGPRNEEALARHGGGAYAGVSFISGNDGGAGIRVSSIGGSCEGASSCCSGGCSEAIHLDRGGGETIHLRRSGTSNRMDRNGGGTRSSTSSIVVGPCNKGGAVACSGSGAVHARSSTSSAVGGGMGGIGGM